MARARNIKPGFFKNEDLAECSPWARLSFAGLWTLADREGRLEDRPKKIKGELFAFDSIEVDPLLDELVRWGFITRYVVDGLALIQINRFSAHQNPHHREPPSNLPPPQSPGLDTVGNSPKPRADSGSNEHEASGEPGASLGFDGQDSTCQGGQAVLIPDSGFLIPDSLHVSYETPPDGAPADTTKAPTMTAKDVVWSLGVRLLGKSSRPFLGKLVSDHGEVIVAAVLADCEREKPGEPKSWVRAACATRQQSAKSGADGANEMLANPTPAWATAAGFSSRFEAENAGCTERNHRQFVHGKKVAA